MKSRLLILGVVALALAVFSCQLHDNEAQVAAAVATADAKTVEVVDLVIDARATQDFAALEAFLAEEDRDGELRALLEEAGVFAPPVQAKAISDLPSFAGDPFKNGDVLLSRSSGSWTSDLMARVLINRGYGHGGILYKTLASATDPSAGCVLSADLEGLNFQTYLEWQAADSIAVMRDNTGLSIAEFDLTRVLYEMPFPYTCYSFLLPEFMPVTKEDPYFWYCSKVPWVVYALIGKAAGVEVDIENKGFYELGNTEGKWTELRDSLLYKVYKLYLTWSLPWWKWRQIPALADAQLKLVLGELVTPDELRWSLAALSHETTYGNAAPDWDWEDYGVVP